MSALTGRSAIVTGGATGLGRAFAEALVAEGVNVTLCDIRDDAPAVAEAMRGPGKAVGVVADIGQQGVAASCRGPVDPRREGAKQDGMRSRLRNGDTRRKPMVASRCDGHWHAVL